ncbi:hypothetical protein SALB1_1257 [Salinisphaera sp. LB1]|nr:hypothetical protein SALB1_1257 [Salinisphaera sp. LB1]
MHRWVADGFRFEDSSKYSASLFENLSADRRRCTQIKRQMIRPTLLSRNVDCSSFLRAYSRLRSLSHSSADFAD